MEDGKTVGRLSTHRSRKGINAQQKLKEERSCSRIISMQLPLCNGSSFLSPCESIPTVLSSQCRENAVFVLLIKNRKLRPAPRAPPSLPSSFSLPHVLTAGATSAAALFFITSVRNPTSSSASPSLKGLLPPYSGGRTSSEMNFSIWSMEEQIWN